MEITILGCGPSYGIPTARSGYGLCNPDNPKNTRTRTSLLLSDKDTTILFDTPPELRQQLYRNHVLNVDAVVFTHMHADHTMGIDDTRIFTVDDKMPYDKENHSLPVYINVKDEAEFQQRFSFYLKPMAYLGQKEAPFDLHLIEAGKPFHIKNLDLSPIAQNHASCESLGFRIGDFAYTTDLKEFINFGLENLKDLKVWVLGCVTTKPNEKHIYLQKALEWFDIVKPDRMILTHLGYRMDYDTISGQLPKGVELAYDGMKISF